MPVVLVASLLVSVVIGAGFYWQTINAQDNKLADVKQEVAVHDAKITSINDTLTSQDSRMIRLENKIDALLNRQGINPLKYQ